LKRKLEEAETKIREEREEKGRLEQQLREKEEEEERIRQEELRRQEEEQRKLEETQARYKAEEEERQQKAAEEAAEAARSKKERCRVCCIVGPPGSIKGKLCELIVQREPDLRNTSAGEVMRDAIRAGTPAGLKARAERESDGQVSEATTLELMTDLLRPRTEEPDTRWLLDGYPRNAEQAMALIRSGIMLGKLVYVEIDDAELVRRAVGRRIDPTEHTLYHIEGIGFPKPPDDPEILARLTQRKDDTEERVRARLKQYFDTNEDMSGEFIDSLKVDGTKEPEAVLDEVIEFLER